MTAAPPGEEVGIGYDWNGPPGQAPKEGQFLRTPSNRFYLITSMRKVNSKAHPSRFKIRALVVEESDVTPDVRVYDLIWNKREKKR